MYIASYSALSVANTFLELAKAQGERLRGTHLMRLVYLAQGVALSVSEGKHILVRERFEAGEYGPTIPSLYNAFVYEYGSADVTAPLTSNNTPSLPILRTDMGSYEVAKATHEGYGKLTGPQLIALVTRQDSPEGYPWHEAWVLRDGQHRPGTDLSDEVMTESFSKIVSA